MDEASVYSYVFNNYSFVWCLKIAVLVIFLETVNMNNKNMMINSYFLHIIIVKSATVIKQHNEDVCACAAVHLTLSTREILP